MGTPSPPPCLNLPVSRVDRPSLPTFHARVWPFLFYPTPLVPPGSDVYVGEWRRGQWEGKGVLSLATGDRFVQGVVHSFSISRTRSAVVTRVAELGAAK